MRRPIDLGSGRLMRLAGDSRSALRFLIFEHPGRDDGGSCIASGRLLARGQPRPDDGHAYWVLESEHPLTLSPSLVCPECGEHGFVRDGRWVPA